MENIIDTQVKCECGHNLSLLVNVNLEGKEYYKLVCKNCGASYVETEHLSGEWQKVE